VAEKVRRSSGARSVKRHSSSRLVGNGRLRTCSAPLARKAVSAAGTTGVGCVREQGFEIPVTGLRECRETHAVALAAVSSSRTQS